MTSNAVLTVVFLDVFKHFGNFSLKMKNSFHTVFFLGAVFY